MKHGHGSSNDFVHSDINLTPDPEDAINKMIVYLLNEAGIKT